MDALLPLGSAIGGAVLTGLFAARLHGRAERIALISDRLAAGSRLLVALNDAYDAVRATRGNVEAMNGVVASTKDEWTALYNRYLELRVLVPASLAQRIELEHLRSVWQWRDRWAAGDDIEPPEHEPLVQMIQSMAPAWWRKP